MVARASLHAAAAVSLSPYHLSLCQSAKALVGAGCRQVWSCVIGHAFPLRNNRRQRLRGAGGGYWSRREFARRKQLRHALAKNPKRLIEFDVLIDPGDLARCHATATNAVPVLDCRGRASRQAAANDVFLNLCGARVYVDSGERTRASAPFPAGTLHINQSRRNHPARLVASVRTCGGVGGARVSGNTCDRAWRFRSRSARA